MSSRLELLTVARALFAWWVVSFHFKEWVFNPLLGKTPTDTIISYGYLGVDFFFVLSGFVIDRRYSHAFQNLKFSVVYDFALLRLARLYPLHIFLLLLMVANPIALFFFAKAKGPSDQYNLLYFAQSVFLIQNWGVGQTLAWNVPAWSISAEMFAYLFYPFIGFVLCKEKSKRPYVAAAVALFCVSTIVLFFVYFSFNSIGDQVTKSGTVRCLLEFALGCTCSRFGNYLCHTSNPRLFIGPLLALAGLLIALSFGLSLKDFVTVPAIVFVSILALSIVDTVFKVKVPKWLILMGNISYATYLCHWIIKSWFIHSDLFIKLETAPLVATYCLTVLICSYLLYRYVEIPAQMIFSKMIKPSEQLTSRHQSQFNRSSK
jgi:peptidoglycan/LPS O-acetylase OafA/YrhL